MFELKRISREAVPRALLKAERYRLLNEPREAESICRDVLLADPDNQEALVTLLLALTDRFDETPGVAMSHPREIAERLQGAYERQYYAGIVFERWAKAMLDKSVPVHVAFGWVREAMRSYERAAAESPPGNDDAILRWNACVRIFQQDELSPEPEEGSMTADVDTADEMPMR